MSMHLKIRPLLKFFIPISLWIHACSSDPKLSDNMIKIKAVKDKILAGYDKNIRPTPKVTNSNTTRIYTGFIPRQILDVNEEKGLFELDSYLYMGWVDPRLAWDKSMFDGYIQLPPELFWLPDVSIFNSHTQPLDPTQNVVLLHVQSSYVTWFPPVRTSTSCPALQEVAYPGDVVRCGVKMGSWAHEGREVDFEHSKEAWTHEFANVHSRWELLVSETRVVRNTASYQGYNDTFYFNEFIFPLKRRPSPEIEATRSPCILVMLLTLSLFWMPPDSPDKLMVGGISLISLVFLLIYVACSTKFPLGVLIAVSFLRSTMYIVVVSILLQVLVIFNLCSITGPARPPAIIMQLLSGPFGKYACLRSTPSSDNIPADRPQLKYDSQSIIRQPTPNEDWILFASGLDRLFFVLVSVSLIAIHHV